MQIPSKQKEKSCHNGIQPVSRAVFLEEQIKRPFFSKHTCYRQSWCTAEDMHYHNYPECGRCLKGDGVFFVEDRLYAFTTGTIVFFPAGMHHIAQSPTERNSLWEYIWLDDTALNLQLPEQEVVSSDRDSNELFRMMWEELQKGEEGSISLYRHLIAAFFEKVTSLTKERLSADKAVWYGISPAIRTIAAEYHEPLSTAQLASICGISESTLRRGFLAVTGRTPAAYVHFVRLLMAEQLLVETELTVMEISERCGFPCLSTFNRQFLKRYGISPRAFRNERRSE